MSSHSHSRPVSQASKRFPEYTGRIPTVPKHERPKRVEHFALRPYVVFTIAPAMVLLGIALQVALFFSMKWNGFRAPPPSKVLSWLSPSFLTSFFPTILIATPMAMTWGLADWAVRWYHPYILLSQGNARAEDSLLLDYIATNKYMGWWSSLRRRHWLVFISMFTGFVANLFQPLAGALISIKPIATTNDFVVRNTAQIGLSPTVGDLNAFLAAAGFTEAAAFQSLPDPPFVKENWAAATIEQPSDPGLNASVQWNTTGVRTQSNCVNAIGVNVSLSGGFGTIDGSTPAGCRASARFNLADADQQYGSAPADPGSCGMDTNTEQHFRPVMFWYFHAAEDNSTQPQARAVICQPTLQVSNAEVTLNLTNSALSNVILLDQYTKTNNVSGGDLDGRAFNAVILDDFAQGKPFVQARATAIRSGIPGAVFRLATQQSGGLEAAFNNDTTFFNLTDKIYTQHLSVSAKSVYFVPDDSQSFARKTALVERIVIDPLACGLLSGALIIVGLVGFVLHAFHLRIRRRSGLYLTTEPGSIATSVALTSHSGFGQLLYPYDDRDEMEKKLQGFRFSLDKRSGAIVADEDETDWEPGFHPAHLRESILVENRANEDRYSMKSAMMASASRLSLVEDLPSVGMEAPRARSPSSPLTGAEESQPLNRSFDESPRRLDISQPFPSPHA